MREIEYTRSSSTTSSQLFGKYEIGKLLGCGAFAKVYHARNVSTGQSVAIKAVSKQKVLKRGFAEHVKREISIMHRMRHPNIVKVYEVLATKTKVYLVMEYAKGGELFARIAKGRFSEDLSRRYFQQLISAVRYCHSRGVFHRDLKPENLLLDENYNLKVTDFGLGAVTDPTRPDGLLHTLCGTPTYLAPEVLAKKGYCGAKVDVWSCGVVLFVLHAGYLPFNDPNLMVLYHRIFKGEFRFPKWTSPDLRRFISRMIDPNPETRITVDEIIDDPWFKKGCYEEIKFNTAEDYDFELKEESQANNKCLNAFDLITFSSGLDLSGLFEVAEEGPVLRDRFISAEKQERIIERIEMDVRGITEEVKATERRENGIRLEGHNGNFVLAVDIHQLTENLVVVEVGSSDEIWKVKLWPKLSDLAYKNEAN